MAEPQRKNVLIVEDDEGVALLEQRRLARAGFQSSHAASADAALETLRTQPIDLILLDYKLPHGVDGLEFYEQLRKSGLDLPVILVTGFGNETLIIKALRIGVRDYITKSMEYLDYLPEAVERVLRQTEMEHRLAESEARLASVISSAKDAILVADAGEIITLFNPAAERMFLCSGAEALGQPLARFFRYDQNKSAAAAATSLTVEVALWTLGVRADGKEFPIEASISRGDVLGRGFHTLVVRDITERKRAEAQILEQAAVLDKANDAILMGDMAGRILYWNQAAERLYGWTSQEVLGRNVRAVLYKSPHPSNEEIDAHFLEHGEWKGERRQCNRAGAEVIVDSRWTLMRDDAGKPRAKLIINTDITERKKLEAQLLRSQRLESLGTLAGGIAHDLNNMLTPIMMAVELLRGAVSDAKSQTLLTILHSSTERGADLVRQILAFARGTTGQTQLLLLHPLLNEIYRLLRQTFPKPITIEASIPADLWKIEGDPTQIHQVVMNLCVNARDAMPLGGRLGIAAQNFSVNEHFARLHPDAAVGPYVLLSVEDNGSGIAPDILDKIFDPFFTTKDLGQGTGLGLSTVIGITRAHRGFVLVYSELGKGSQFHVYLPAQESDASRAEGAQHAGLPTGNGEVLLVIDDEMAILQLAKAILEAHGYRVVISANGQEALSLFEKQRAEIKLVLTDLAMPVFDGRATIRALRLLDAHLPIVATSGFVPSWKDDADLKSVQGLLAKPYSAESLLTMVHNVLTGNAPREDSYRG